LLDIGYSHDTTLGLVIEDAIAGLKSGRAAGALTLAVCTSNPRQTILDSNVDPHYIVTDLTKCVYIFVLTVPHTPLTIYY
jgi:beta-phosphoglucomutase-like phosphatase (HAD superfamily)